MVPRLRIPIGLLCFLLGTTSRSNTIHAFVVVTPATSQHGCSRNVGSVLGQGTAGVLSGPDPHRPIVALGMAKKGKGKGFAPRSSKVESTSPPANDSASSAPSQDAREAEAEAVVQRTPGSPPVNAGQRALQKLRDQRQKEKDDELRRVKQLKEMDDIYKTDKNAAVIPEKVAMRMGQRMLPFVGVPLIGGMGAFVAFWYLATYQNYEFQPAVVAGTTIGLLAVGLIGITYSVISASWDEDREGSVLGFDEFSNNVQSLKDGLGRSRDNAILRDKMQGLPEEEIQAALRDLERREKRAEKKEQSFEQKMKDEGL